jgi:glycosyltransferase involved in cell wall biosynthesis
MLVSRSARPSRFKVVIALNTAWNLVNFRAGLIRSLVGAGYEVVAVAPDDNYAPRLAEMGCRFVSIKMDNQGTHPGRDLILFLQLIRLLRLERPAVFLGYTVKPNVYGSLAARWVHIPVINNVAGLGAVFVRGGWLAHIVRWMYRAALARSHRVFFQNNDDRRMFIEAGLVRPEKTDCLPGSGVDITRFAVASMATGVPIRFLLIARMLWDKGVGEFVEAARLLRARYPQAEFCLLGFLDVKNPSAITREQMAGWVAEGVIRYLGETDDVSVEIARAHCIVLPSYREGVPRTLLEAAAMGRPIVTTDAVGCREVVNDGENGFLCRPRDASDLAEKMARVIQLSPEAREEMGRKGRAKVERQFDERFVIEKYLEVISEIVAAPLGKDKGERG